MTGVDISRTALDLANENLKHNINEGHLRSSASSQISFSYGNILHDSFRSSDIFGQSWDIVTSNPPYISERGFSKDTGRSVRNHEPKLALTPTVTNNFLPYPEDTFYPDIFEIASAVGAKLVLVETSGSEQALRVAKYAVAEGSWKDIEIWRDWPDQPSDPADGERDAGPGDVNYDIKGAGHGRTVVCRV